MPDFHEYTRLNGLVNFFSSFTIDQSNKLFLVQTWLTCQKGEKRALCEKWLLGLLNSKLNICGGVCFYESLEAVVSGCSSITVFLKILKYFTRKHLYQIPFLIKLQGLRPLALLKRDRNTGVFLFFCFSLKQLKVSENKIEDPISMPFLRASQGPTPQTLPSKM